jgi:tripartite ATP-independent transporter DctP family solute receptor
MAWNGFAEDPTYKLRLSTMDAPEADSTMAAQKFADVLEILSGGKVKVDVFHSGQLGDQKTQILDVMRGTLDMTIDTSPGWFADLANYPQIGVLDTPYVYRDLDHAYRVLTGPVGQKHWDYLAKNAGLRVLDIWYMGTRELNLVKKAGPVRRPEDLRGIKLRMPNVESWLDIGRALGATPTPLGFGEVYMALKSGTIEGQDNPLPTSDWAKFYEVTHYIILTDHVMGFITPVINEKLWQDMPEEYRVYIQKAILVGRYYMNQITLEKELSLLGKFREEYGMEIIIPDKQAFMESANKFYSKPKFDKKWGKGMYQKIQSMQ